MRHPGTRTMLHVEWAVPAQFDNNPLLTMPMKRIGFTLLLAAVLSVCAATLHAEETAGKSASADTANAMQFGLGRGVANLFLGWLEIPRNFGYEFTARPVSAIVIAPLMGATMTAVRTGYGLVDLLSFGYHGNYDYGAGIPDYPWLSPWVAAQEADYE